jgi:hypothetical protein
LIAVFEKRIFSFFRKLSGKESPQVKPVQQTKNLKFDFELTYIYNYEMTSIKKFIVTVNNRYLTLSAKIENLTARPEFESTPKVKNVAKTISEADEHLIINYFRDCDFDQNIKEDKPKKGTGVRAFLKFQLYSPIVSQIHIEGQYEISGTPDDIRMMWGKDYLTRTTNLDNFAFFAKCDDFLRFISALTVEKIPDAR